MIWRALVAAVCLQLVALVAGQAGQTELPAITGPAVGNDCGGCYVVADVAGIVFGSEQLTATEVQVVSVGVGRNGTNVTTTSVIDAMGQFTFGTQGLFTATGPGFVSYGGGTIITVAGATLTSPTPYEVFSAYSVTSTIVSNGQCVAVPGTRNIVEPAFSVAIPPNAGASFIIEAENSFIQQIGLPTCSPGGANVMQTTQTVVNTQTLTSTTVGPILMTPQAISTMAPPTPTNTQIGFIQAATSALAAESASAARGTSTALTTATTTQVSVGTIVVVGNATGTYTGPAISIYSPGANAAPSHGPSSTWVAVAVTLAVLLAACAMP